MPITEDEQHKLDEAYEQLLNGSNNKNILPILFGENIKAPPHLNSDVEINNYQLNITKSLRAQFRDEIAQWCVSNIINNDAMNHVKNVIITLGYPDSSNKNSHTALAAFREDYKARLMTTLVNLLNNNAMNDFEKTLSQALKFGVTPNSLNEPFKAKLENSQLLNKALENKNWELAKTLINLGANVNLASPLSTLPLIRAAENGQLELSRLLLAKGVGVNARDKNGDTPMIAAARSGNLDVFTLLKNQGADILGTNEHTNTPLSELVKYNTVSTVKAFLEAHKDMLNAHDDSNKTLLHYAIEANKSDVANMLLGLGADPTIKNGQGKTAVDLAQKSNNTTIKALFDRSPTGNIKPAIENKNTTVKPLTQTQEKSLIELIKLGDATKVADFIKANPNINYNLVSSGPGKPEPSSILQVAIQTTPVRTARSIDLDETVTTNPNENKYSVLNTLLQQGKVNPNQKLNMVIKTGMTALHMAADTGDKQLAQILLKNGAKTNVLLNDNSSPLTLAKQPTKDKNLQKNRKEVAKILVVATKIQQKEEKQQALKTPPKAAEPAPPTADERRPSSLRR